MFFGLHSPCTILIQYECHETYCTDYKSKKKRKKLQWLSDYIVKNQVIVLCMYICIALLLNSSVIVSYV